MDLIGVIYKPLTKRAARSAFVGKNRVRNSPEHGRFTPKEVSQILREAWQKFDENVTNLPPQPTRGARVNIRLACLCLSMLTVLRARGIERQYAIELISDAAWWVYRKWAVFPRWTARLFTPNPAEQMRICVNAFLRFPFNPPGYRFERLPSDSGVAFNITKCPIAHYLRSQDAADLCLGSWCNLDFALAEMWGGMLKRTQTLANGEAHCDFRFIR